MSRTVLGAQNQHQWATDVLDGERTAGRFHWTMAAIRGSKRYRPGLRFVALDLPVPAGVDLRELSWQDRRERLELLREPSPSPTNPRRASIPSVA